MPERKYQSGGYRYGFDGKEKDDDIGDASVDFGARIFSCKLGRWFSTDPSEKKFPSESPYIFCSNRPIAFIDPDGKEKVIVVGSENRDWRLNFALPAMKLLKEIGPKKPGDESTTVLLFKENYTQRQLQRIRKFANRHGVPVIFVNSANDVVNYMNTKSIDGHSNTRNSDLISRVDVFSHGLPGSFEFGYGTPKADEYRFGKSHVEKLVRESFQTNGVFNSYACRTGAGNDSEDGNVAPENSLAQKIADQICVTVYAYIKKSEYGNIIPDNRTTTQKIKEKVLGGGDKTYNQHSGSWDTDEAIDRIKYPTQGESPSKSPSGTFIFRGNQVPVKKGAK